MPSKERVVAWRVEGGCLRSAIPIRRFGASLHGTDWFGEYFVLRHNIILTESSYVDVVMRSKVAWKAFS